MARWFICDPCGVGCLTFGIFTVLFVDYVTVWHIVLPWFKASWRGWLHIGVFQVAIFMIIASYLRAATTDPGSVPLNTHTKNDVYPPATDAYRVWKPKRRFCDKCQCIKPPRAHHCSTCNRCINKMDHHCPWVNNCVGSNNMKFFLLFLFWTFIGSTYAAVLAIWRVVSCWKSKMATCAVPDTHTIIACVFSTVLAIFFAIFVVAMFCDQYEGMTTNTTAVESIKGWDEQSRSFAEGARDACGQPFGLAWFVPVPMPEDSPSFFKWKPTDDPDAYDPRDPIIQRHFQRIEEAIAKGTLAAPPVAPVPGAVAAGGASTADAASAPNGDATTSGGTDSNAMAADGPATAIGGAAAGSVDAGEAPAPVPTSAGKGNALRRRRD